MRTRTISETRANSKRDSLRHMQSMLRELREQALGEQCAMLGYLLEMAYVETSDILRQIHEESQAGQ